MSSLMKRAGIFFLVKIFKNLLHIHKIIVDASFFNKDSLIVGDNVVEFRPGLFAITLKTILRKMWIRLIGM
jgi:hypothetical protein